MSRRSVLLVASLGVLVLVGGFLVLVAVKDESGPRPRPRPGLVARTEQGEARGQLEAGIRTWRGLPYATPPIGERRWRRPARPAPWEGVRDATQVPAPCLQPELYSFAQEQLSVLSGSSEDCLYLNVSRPDDARTDLPVLVFVHGGAFLGGEANRWVTESAALVDRGIVVVTIQYRLGKLGFFAHPGLNQGIANFGLLDQVAALTWVHDNVTEFGGDPGRVTVMGSSAGAMSVNALMASSVARGLFSGAIAMSAPGDDPSRSLQEARSDELLNLGALTDTQLRALPPEQLLSSRFNVLFGDAPILDRVLPEPSAVTFAAGRQADVPYLVGSSDDEFSDDDFRLFDVDPEAVRATLGGSHHDALVASYGRRTYDDHVLDDLVFGAPAARLAALHAPLAPTYRYLFAGKPDGTAHTSELPYAFDAVRDPAAQLLAEATADYWAAFVMTGAPEPAGLPAWPEADATALMAFTPAGPVAVAADPFRARQVLLTRWAALMLPRASDPD